MVCVTLLTSAVWPAALELNLIDGGLCFIVDQYYAALELIPSGVHNCFSICEKRTKFD